MSSLITQLGVFGMPEEYFTEEMLPHLIKKHGTSSFEILLPKIIDSYSLNNVFGFQIDPLRLKWMLNMWDLQSAFADKSISLSAVIRYDLFSQAYSYLSSKKTGVWHVRSGDPSQHLGDAHQFLGPSDQSSLSSLARELFAELLLILRSELRISRLVNDSGIQIAVITYEEFVSDRYHTICKLLRGLDANDAVLTSLSEKQDILFSNPTKKIGHPYKEVLFDYVYKNYRDIVLTVNELRQELIDEVSLIVRQ